MRSVALAWTVLLCGCTARVTAVPESLPLSVPAPRFIGPGRLVPDLQSSSIPAKFVQNGVTLHLSGGLRIAIDANGKVERGSEQFAGAVDAEELPSRLGGGFVFFQSDGLKTELWRAEHWTGALRPLARLSRPTLEVIVGFDRLYLRGRYNDLVGLAPDLCRRA